MRPSSECHGVLLFCCAIRLTKQGDTEMKETRVVAVVGTGVRLGIMGMVLTGLLLASGCSSNEDTHPGQPVTHRKLLFKQMVRTLEPMGLMVRGRRDYDPEQFIVLAGQLKGLSTKPWVYFTPDSNYPPTRAKPDVWDKPADFRAAQQKFINAADALVTAASSRNMDTIKPSFAAVESSCKACHQQFRGIPH